MRYPEYCRELAAPKKHRENTQIRKETMMEKYKKNICIIVAVALLGVTAFCSYQIYHHYSQETEQVEAFDDLAKIVEQPTDTEEEVFTEDGTALPEYGDLFLQNADMVGWIKIDGTNINYPVMQTPNNPNYYLKHNFYKEYSDLGVPYVQENCNIATSDNLIIYDHYIRGEKMFGALESYKTKSFYDAYVDKCKELSLYNTGVTTEYGDRLITLSTCEYSATNGRLVVVAKKVL